MMDKKVNIPTLIHLFIVTWAVAVPFCSFAQQAPGDINRRQILEQIISKARQYSLYRTQVNWLELQRKLAMEDSSQIAATVFEQWVKLVFQELGDKHATLLFKGRRMVQGPVSPLNIRPALINPFKNGKPGIRIAALENGYAYILIPPGSKNDATTLQRLQDSLCALDPVHLKGIIIDLRLHEGGSIYPMAALSQLYGSNIVGYNSSIDGALQHAWKVKNGKYYQGDKMVASVEMKCKANGQLRIAVLISQLTASAGEIMAVAFKGRAHTIFMGEKTYGLTTINSEFDLGSGYYLALSAAFLADRNGNCYKTTISPDREIVEGDNFENLSQDRLHSHG
jgi:hypothetical protein